ncbi:transcription factor E2F3 isoform X2 [Fundulus heteroclitus]|uniref:transcription factor E2F3 isoform X2 n=1 Tax=Fundulus heteroclitus TaxID=8078 RepID=UPI00165AAD47|nr:transcription factor E2F3 isoform X2 [Fundulus heteroclitus]
MIPAAAPGRARKNGPPVFSLMGKCVVSGCPNRMASFNRGVLNRAPKRFFKFPSNPNRVKVWLAALRETDKDPAEQHIICEDHFLPEDVSRTGISSDAIPVMPPYLDGPRRLIGSLTGDSLEEEEQWWSGGGDNEDEEEGEEEAPRAPEPPQQNPSRSPENPSEPNVNSDFAPENEAGGGIIREGTPLSGLTRGFLELLMAAPDASVDVREAAAKLQTYTRRVHAIIDVLLGIGLVQRDSDNRVRWIGSGPIYSFLWRDTLKFLTMLQRLKAMEDELDRIFKSCAQQLFELTENQENSALAYVGCDDIRRLRDFQQQTMIIIRSPPDTKLIIPPPAEDGIRMQLNSENGPIVALTCDGGPLTSEPANSSRVFSALESRIRVSRKNKAESKKTAI